MALSLVKEVILVGTDDGRFTNSQDSTAPIEDSGKASDVGTAFTRSIPFLGLSHPSSLMAVSRAVTRELEVVSLQAIGLGYSVHSREEKARAACQDREGGL